MIVLLTSRKICRHTAMPPDPLKASPTRPNGNAGEGEFRMIFKSPAARIFSFLPLWAVYRRVDSPLGLPLLFSDRRRLKVLQVQLFDQNL